ncbi:hypothetical protein, partial [Acinetobacter baumannii]|uniref:hypothetical protein n=7 Tax=Acinetobacter baumannii TaxID=470 RepID=UPI0006A12976
LLSVILVLILYKLKKNLLKIIFLIIVSHKLIFNIFELIFINIFVSRGSIRFKIAIFEWTIYLDAKMINILVLYFD